MWRELQQLKAFRERRAQLALLARRHELAAARREHQAAEQALQAHRRLADEHERTLYAELLRRQVRLRDIEQVQLSVAQLRRTETTLADRAQQAAGVQQQREQQAGAAQAEHRAAERVREKFDQLALLHDAETARAAERAEDLEFEEVASLRRDREDWDHADEAAA